MELKVNNWRFLHVKTFSEKLKIQYEILSKIKLKYCPNTRKTVRKQIPESVFKENIKFKKTLR